MDFLVLASAVAMGSALAAGQLMFAWFFMGQIEDRAALRLATISGYAAIALAATAWCIRMAALPDPWYDPFVLSWLAALAVGIALLGHRRAAALASA